MLGRGAVLLCPGCLPTGPVCSPSVPAPVSSLGPGVWSYGLKRRFPQPLPPASQLASSPPPSLLSEARFAHPWSGRVITLSPVGPEHHMSSRGASPGAWSPPMEVPHPTLLED